MQWFKRFIKPWMLFLVTALAITLLLPNQVFFQYEYQVGRPWMHQKLDAPFDFAIQKTNREQNQQREALKKAQWVVLRVDSSAERRVKRAWQNVLSKYTVSLSKDQWQALQKGADSLLERGIHAQSQTQFPVEVVHVLFPNQELRTRLKERMVSLSEAAEWPEKWPSNLDSLIRLDLKQAWQQSLEPNLYPDVTWSERLKERTLDALPGFRGLILEGELVIDQGEMVTAERFRVLNSLRAAYQEREATALQRFGTFAGQFLFVTIWVAFLFAYFKVFRKLWLRQPRRIGALLALLCFHVGLARLAIEAPGGHIYMAPAIMFPILVRALFDSRTAIFSLFTYVLICGYFAPNSFEYVLLQFAGGLIAVFSFRTFRKRAQLFSIIGMLLVVWSFLNLTLHLLRTGSLVGLDWYPFLCFAISGVATLFTFALVFITEKLFGFHSDFTLLELSDMNNPLLKKLSQKAPGTFQHSIQVANLAEAAAEKTGANSLLVHTAALYHDIGKLKQPGFFIENMMGKQSPHEVLSFEQSANIIIQHVEEGVALAKKHKLPEVLIDFIRTHHGTSTVQYFYRNYLKAFPEDQEVRARFSYPGPKPFSKETGILMMADSVEAASRSLKEKTPEALTQLVDKIMDYQLSEGQLDHSDLTLSQMRIIRKVFKEKLLNMYHQRIEYPEDSLNA